MGAFIQPLNNQSIDVFQIFHLASVEMYDFFYHTIGVCLDIQLRSTVSEHKKLTMLVVCNPIHIVHATPYVLILLVYSISSGFW